MIRMKTIWSISLAVVACLWVGAAEAAGKRVGVPAFDGTQEALVRKKVMAVLQAHGFELVKSRQIASALQSSGARLDSNDGFQALAKELALGAIVTGEVGKKRAKIRRLRRPRGLDAGRRDLHGRQPTEASPPRWDATSGRSWGPRSAAGKVPSNAKKSQKAVAEAPEDAVDSRDAESGSDETPPPAKKAPVAAAEPEEKAKPDEKGAEDGEEKPKKKKKKEAEEEEPSGPSVVPPTLDVSVGMAVSSRATSGTTSPSARCAPTSWAARPRWWST